MGDFATVLGRPGVEEVCELRGPVGFMAYHGGDLELMTDVIARRAADAADASLYAVLQPAGMRAHFPSTTVVPGESAALAEFLDHVDIVVTIHGFGRRGMFGSLLLGGQNRGFAEHVGVTLRRHLPAYDVVTELDSIPKQLRGLHDLNPVNVPRHGGVQIELPPRVRGTSPLWWDWEGPELTPHTESLIDGLAAAAIAYRRGSDPG
ncbi:poly-gamma-glutamate hydrolase family protein [Ilumatobacter nonamiensis]|uniref:poly-gamma-glutamate hydrolase family protein n=1 Tax=Ilumatobacter nonamiensis TaxID=467093 RepID=UPI0019D399D0|nr:poly-gamma-glutamate hydrolase family protein [Ilumatobacter nonamiensis]